MPITSDITVSHFRWVLCPVKAEVNSRQLYLSHLRAVTSLYVFTHRPDLVLHVSLQLWSPADFNWALCSPSDLLLQRLTDPSPFYDHCFPICYWPGRLHNSSSVVPQYGKASPPYEDLQMLQVLSWWAMSHNHVEEQISRAKLGTLSEVCVTADWVQVGRCCLILHYTGCIRQYLSFAWKDPQIGKCVGSLQSGTTGFDIVFGILSFDDIYSKTSFPNVAADVYLFSLKSWDN